jgi:hypothetical protein
MAVLILLAFLTADAYVWLNSPTRRQARLSTVGCSAVFRPGGPEWLRKTIGPEAATKYFGRVHLVRLPPAPVDLRTEVEVLGSIKDFDYVMVDAFNQSNAIGRIVERHGDDLRRALPGVMVHVVSGSDY